MKISNPKRFMMALILGVSITGRVTGQGLEQPNREDVQGMVDAYILSKLQESLELTDAQFASMVVAQKKLQDTRRDYRRDRMNILRQMRRTLERSQEGEADLQSLLSELETLEKRFHTDERERYAAIDEILDVRQRARYRILEVELQRRLTRMMRQARDQREQRRPQLNR